MAEDILIGTPATLRFATNGFIRPRALSDYLVGAYRFNLKPGETQEEAADRCSWNLAPGGTNRPKRLRWPGGIPTFYSGYARFTEATLFDTGLADFTTAGGCVLLCARTQDTNIASATTRGFLIGSFGGNTAKGWCVEFANYASGQVRGFDYNAAGSLGTVSTVDVGSAEDMEDWRLYYWETGRPSGSDATYSLANVNPGDGITPAPTPYTMVGGRSVGQQTITIGGRISDSTSDYADTIHKDIAFALIFSGGLPDAPAKTTLIDQGGYLAQRAGITLGAA